jgi:hypothetical protein
MSPRRAHPPTVHHGFNIVPAFEKAGDVSQERTVMCFHAPKDSGNLGWDVVDNNILEYPGVVMKVEGHDGLICWIKGNLLLGESNSQLVSLDGLVQTDKPLIRITQSNDFGFVMSGEDSM